ncbi:MAG: hypothetical protein KDD39_03400, partial [Bdellovibrionales bacterium]|nr:hypothetical protein [Bdellovibrionales bacterium]
PLAKEALRSGWKEWGRQSRMFEDELGVNLALNEGGDVLWSLMDSSLQQRLSIADNLDLAEKNPRYKKVLEGLWKDPLKSLHLDDDDTDWERLHPGAAQLWRSQSIEDKIDALRKGGLSPQQKKEYADLFAQFLKKQKELAKPSGEEMSEQRRAQLEKEIAEKYAPYFGLSSVLEEAGKKIPELGALSHATRGALQIGQLLDRFSNNLISAPQLLMGSYGIVSGLIQGMQSILNPRPSDTQILLEAIGRLHTEVRELRIELAEFRADVRQWFDELEASLMNRLGNLERTLNANHRELSQLLYDHAKSMGATQEQLLRLEQNMLSAFTEVAMRDIRNFHSRVDWTKEDLDYFNYNDTMAAFYNCARFTATDTTMSGRIAGLTGGEGIVALLEKLHQPLNTTTDYWNRIGATASYYRELGLEVHADPIPNPKVWALCASDYLKMAKKWPEYFARHARTDQGSLSNLAGILQTGNSLREFLKQVEAQSKADNGMQEELFAYQPKLINHLGDEMGNLLADFKKKHHFTAATLYGNQPDDAVRKEYVVNRAIPNFTGKIGKCSGFSLAGVPTNKDKQQEQFGDPVLEVNGDQRAIIAAWIPTEIHILEQLGVGNIHICYDEFGFTEEVSNRDANVPQQVREDFPTTMAFTIRWNYAKTYTRFRMSFVVAEDFRGPFPNREVVFDQLRTTTRRYYELSGSGRGADMITMAMTKDGQPRMKLNELIKQSFMGEDHNPNSGHKAEIVKDWASPVLHDVVLAGKRKEFEEMLRSRFDAPVGDTATYLKALDASRAAIVDYARLVIGDGFITDEYAPVRDALAKLPDGAAFQKAVRARPELFAQAESRKQALSELLAPYQALHTSLKKLALDEKLAQQRHALLEDVLEPLESFFLGKAQEMDDAIFPAYFPEAQLSALEVSQEE